MNANYTTLENALATAKAEYKNRLVIAIKPQVKHLLDDLQANGMDINKVAPQPDRTCNPYEADRRDTARRWANLWVKRDNSVHSSCMPGSPYIVVARGGLDEMVDKYAEDRTNEAFVLYIAKLSKKIGQPASSAQLVGSLFDYSTLTVVLENGETQKWKTRCIMNTSCRGKVFNQWPTRRIL